MEKGCSLIIQVWQKKMIQFLLAMLGLGQGYKDYGKRLPKNIPRNTSQLLVDRCVVKQDFHIYISSKWGETI